MANQKHIECFLSNEQIRELVTFVIDQFGFDLSGDELTESISLALEDVPGIESESDQAIHRLLNQVRNLYHDTIKQKN
jgi:hypothetical protein